MERLVEIVGILGFFLCLLHQVMKRSRLVVMLVSPWLNIEQIMCAIPMEGKTGKGKFHWKK